MVELRRAGHQGKLRTALEGKEQPAPLHVKLVLAGPGIMGTLHTGSVQGVQPAGNTVGDGQGINAPLFQAERIRQDILFHPAPGSLFLFPETEGRRSQLKLQLRNIHGGNHKGALQQIPAAELRFNVFCLEGG